MLEFRLSGGLPGAIRIAVWGLVVAASGAGFFGPGVVRAQLDDDDEFRPGLVGHYTGAGRASRTRIDARVAFDGTGDAIARRLGDGRVRVRWAGNLMSQTPGDYRLLAHFAGQLKIRLAGQVVLDAERAEPGWQSSAAIPLQYDFHPLEIDYSSGDGQPRVSLFWSGPQFGVEPIAERFLFHEPLGNAANEPAKDDPSPPGDSPYERGAALVRQLRCAACHLIEAEPPPPPAPALDRLAGNIHEAWLVDRLHDHGAAAEEPADVDAIPTGRRMPRFGLTREDATAVAAFLLQASGAPAGGTAGAQGNAKSARRVAEDQAKPARKRRDGNPSPGDETHLERGEKLLLSLGCLACHQHSGLGTAGLYGGGDLTRIGAKRPAQFFDRWLAAPEQINQDCRMPVFELSREERLSLAAFLTRSRGSESDSDKDETAQNAAENAANKVAEDPPDKAIADRRAEQVRDGRRLVERHGCANCHRLPESAIEKRRPIPLRLATPSGAVANRDAADDGCLGALPDGSSAARPGYLLRDADRSAIRQFLSASAGRAASNRSASGEPAISGCELFAELNCLACHARGLSRGIAPVAVAIAERHGDLAALVPGMTPPSLNSVGDKLHEASLAAAIARRDEARREYLQVRMPKFRLSDKQLATLVDFFAVQDRIPPGVPGEVASDGANATETDERRTDASLSPAALAAAGSRLVTTDGFGCTSCHQVADVEPTKAPLNARGPNLSLLGRRIRRSWFDRFVADPARIVPQMEMPSVRVAVRGVLDDDVHRQLAAVWDVLNTPGFRPPLPDPVRVVRRSGMASENERAVMITDVLRDGDATWVKPLLIGLPNRHNVLMDLATGSLASWSIGDVARQRTSGKTWFWEAAGTSLLETALDQADIQLVHDQERLAAELQGQFVTGFDVVEHDAAGLKVGYRLRFGVGAKSVVLRVEQSFHPLGFPGETDGEIGFRRRVSVRGIPPGDAVRVPLISHETARIFEPRGTLALGSGSRVMRVDGEIGSDGAALVTSRDGRADIELEYRTAAPVDRFPPIAIEAPLTPSEELFVVPGFAATRLPLSEEIMPTALTWRPDGSLVVASLKGRVWIGRDEDGDGMEDRLHQFSDELAAPYGLAATDEYVDVLNKYALLRLYDRDRDGIAERYETVAAGWGHTVDYHDWAVGLPRDGAGGYYVALPCQQDGRSAAAAALRGELLRLTPREPDDDDPYRFRIERVSAGHRFPMGIARDRSGELFVTDNQGNYNPFNELNHVIPGRRYGFINAIERRPDFRPPLTEPAIDIPHPWTRSVNGICFLETPANVLAASGEEPFGPFEGHLIGCEYDTRRLIRMSLQRVGDSFQGAAYPFSLDAPPSGPPLLGPLVCEVAPDGDLMVGGIRDSGWGGANNIGELVRLRPQPGNLPCGIVEVRAVRGGFELQFTRPVVKRRAVDAASYSISSYTRDSTPAYGGDDRDRRVERIRNVELAADATRVRLALDELRPGFVYELRLKHLAEVGEQFFPAEAYYTLRSVPE